MGSLPPGDMGLPVVGETPAFLRNTFRFLEDRHRLHGNIFKSNVLGRRVVFLAGIDGAQSFFDAENITRTKAHPFPLVDLFGGVNMEMYDGSRHFALKSMSLDAFDHAAIAGYLPDLQRLIETTLARLADSEEFSATAEMRKLAIEAICWNILGVSPGPETHAITADYATMLQGLKSIPLPLPGTPYRRARAARDRLLTRHRQIIAQRRSRPGADGLSRMLAARPSDGQAFTDDEALLEAHHILVAGFIVYGLMAEVLRRLAQDAVLRQSCSAEIGKYAGAGYLSMERLENLPSCMNVVLETKRLVPLVPLAFGRARRTFKCGEFEIPESWTVYLALHLSNRDPDIYTDPDKFDPDRFAVVRAEHRKHPLAFIPQGADPPTSHRCLGLDYSTIVVLTFLTLLVRGYDWELPTQDFEYNWSKLPPEAADGLRVRMWPKNGAHSHDRP